MSGLTRRHVVGARKHWRCCMNVVEVVNALRKEADENKVSNAVLHVFAVRQRARNVIILNSLANRMRREGFSFKKEEYVPLLKLMANLGLGVLMLDPKGKVKGLKDIRITLQSIGTAGCGHGNELKSFIKRNKFTPIPAPIDRRAPESVPTTPGLTVSLEFMINGKFIKIPVPKNFTADDVAALLKRIKGA